MISISTLRGAESQSFDSSRPSLSARCNEQGDSPEENKASAVVLSQVEKVSHSCAWDLCENALHIGFSVQIARHSQYMVAHVLCENTRNYVTLQINIQINTLSASE